MSLFPALVLGLAMGLVFGIALEKSRVFEPGVIVGQMQLKTFTMLKIFLSAVATGLVLLAILNGVGLIKLAPKATLVGADLIGGLLLGAGIAIAGACPGTVFAQIGAGYRDAWATLAGGLAGALAFTYVEPVLNPILLTGGPGKLTLDVVFGVSFPLLAIATAVLIVIGLAFLEQARPWRSEIGDAADGVIPTPVTASPPVGQPTAATK